MFTIVLPTKDEDERRRRGQALEVHQAEKTRQDKTRQDKTRQGTHATWQQQRSRGMIGMQVTTHLNLNASCGTPGTLSSISALATHRKRNHSHTQKTKRNETKRNGDEKVFCRLKLVLAFCSSCLEFLITVGSLRARAHGLYRYPCSFSMKAHVSSSLRPVFRRETTTPF